MTATTAHRPDTTMGRALAGRALALEALHSAHRRAQPARRSNLVTPIFADLPAHVRNAAKDALDRGETHYTVRPGVPELRRAIANVLEAEGFSANVDRTVVTNGGAEALYIALQATLAGSARIAVPSVVDPSTIEMIDFIGATIVRLDDAVADRFLPSTGDIASIEADCLLLASPSTVTGAALPPRELTDVVKAALDQGMSVILDRSLGWCLYAPGGEQFLDRQATEKILVIGSFSISHSLRGWQVGYFVAPEDQLGKLRGLKQAMSICTTAVSQFAALAALQGPEDWIEERRLALSARRDSAVTALATAGLSVVSPDAYPSLLIDTRNIDPDDDVVVERLAKEADVVVEGGSQYGEAAHGLIRIDLDADQEALVSGIERIADMRGGASDE